jgi:hypothetical protein
VLHDIHVFNDCGYLEAACRTAVSVIVPAHITLFWVRGSATSLAASSHMLCFALGSGVYVAVFLDVMQAVIVQRVAACLLTIHTSTLVLLSCAFSTFAAQAAAAVGCQIFLVYGRLLFRHFTCTGPPIESCGSVIICHQVMQACDGTLQFSHVPQFVVVSAEAVLPGCHCRPAASDAPVVGTCHVACCAPHDAFGCLAAG